MRAGATNGALTCLMVVAVLNFLAFFSVALYLGGDALSGKVDNGHFYLASHGRYTEVSARVFAYSKWHTYSVWLTHSAALVAACWLWLRDRAAPNG
jgi:hypothetical protein